MSKDSNVTSQSSKLLKLKGFKIQHRIGSGSFSTVYKATTDNEDHVEVAIKCIDKTKVSGKWFDNIVNEIKVLKLLHHEYIVSMLDFQWDERYVYIILEYCEGGDLSTFIKSKEKLSEFQVQRFVRQLVLALKYLRDNNVCHLDLKPQNVLLKNNCLKLADFGFAQVMAPDEHGASRRGSPLYMAPEVLAGAQYDSGADLWSLGVLAYEALFGQAPYAACSLSQLRAQALSPAPTNIPPNSFSFECTDFLSRLLVKDPSRRMTHDQLFLHPFPDLTHTPGRDSYASAAGVASRAVTEDERGRPREAFTLYCEAMNYLIPLAYEESDTAKKKELQEKIEEYRKRAEELRGSLICEHRPKGPTARDVSSTDHAAPSYHTSLRQFALSIPNLKSGLEIGEAGEMYLAEGNYNVALEKLKSSLNILIPLCEAEAPASHMKPALTLQIQDWLTKAEQLQTIVEASRLEVEKLNATAVNSKCSLQ